MVRVPKARMPHSFEEDNGQTDTQAVALRFGSGEASKDISNWPRRLQVLLRNILLENCRDLRLLSPTNLKGRYEYHLDRRPHREVCGVSGLRSSDPLTARGGNPR